MWLAIGAKVFEEAASINRLIIRGASALIHDRRTRHGVVDVVAAHVIQIVARVVIIVVAVVVAVVVVVVVIIHVETATVI